MKTIAFFTRILRWLTGSRLTVDNSVVRELDLDRFLGSWYEVARFDHFFKRGMSQTKANYVLIGSGSDGYLWILSRTPQLADSDRATILSEAKTRGYDTDKLIWVKQG